MATIKSFTDIEQSRKLAEILPLESADMVLPFRHPKNDEYIPGYVVSRNYVEVYNEMMKLPAMEKEDVRKLIHPSWSLAALTSIIPQEIFDGEYIINITEGCDNKWVLTYDHYENRNHSYYGLSTGDDNLVDACYELIIKLNELKMM